MYYSLVASSSFFLAPTAYGFYRGHRLLPATSLITMAVSIAYWIGPFPNEKKAMDIILCTSSGLIYFLYGWRNILSPSTRMFGYAIMMGIITSYQTACIMCPVPIWIPFHMIFHSVSALGHMFVIYSC